MRGSGDQAIAPAGVRSLAVLHWREYLIEGGALATFMISACTVGVLLEHPASRAHAFLPDALPRRAVFGVLMGLTAIALIYSPWGRRSGAQMNPAVTLTFLRLGRIAPHDAIGYVVAQFVGGAAGVMVASRMLGAPLAHPAVHFVVTRPGMLGAFAAFVAEVAISALLMTMVLETGRSPRWKAFTGVIAGALVALFITVEAPVSGMSMNAARSVGSALAAEEWSTVWIYFIAPLTGMMLAAELFVRRRGRQDIPCGKLAHADPCLFCQHVAARSTVGTLSTRETL
ncbi:MAG: MIP/aquaporin family protein [Gemmatimonadaceae bacterium]